MGLPGITRRVEAGAWNRWAPRFGVAFDVSGNGKTVAKATWGKFNDDLGLREYSVSFSANQPLQYNYRWHDLNGDGNYQPGEVNLDLNGPDYLSVNPGPGFGAVGAGNNIVNPDLKLPHTNEGSASLERELGQGLSVRGLFVYKKLYDAITNVNTWSRSVPTGHRPGTSSTCVRRRRSGSGGSRKLSLALDAFNAFNSNVAWGGGSNGSGITDASGPTYGYVVGIVTPRVLRFGITYEF